MAGRISALLALLLGAMVGAAGFARADPKPEPVISGVAQVGQTLTAQLRFDGDEDHDSPSLSAWQWLRCADDRKDESCALIDGARGSSYVVAAADVGARLRVAAILEDDKGKSKVEVSDATDAVMPGAAPTPTPTPTPPRPTPTPAAPPPPPPPAHRTSRRLLNPFPIIRIRGRLTSSGARVTLLSVRAPRAARIAVRCYGGSCPVRRLAVATVVKRLRRFELRLRAGTRLVIKVTKRGFVGKWSVFTIRRGRAPTRLDRCVNPGGRRPVPCPAT